MFQIRAKSNLQRNQSNRFLSSLTKNIGILDQYTRRNSIRIYGIDDTNKNETPADTEQKVQTFLKDKLDIDLDPTDIDIAHRIGKYIDDSNRSAICKFIYRTHKLKVISARKINPSDQGESYITKCKTI
jgi:hypothetical protein